MATSRFVILIAVGLALMGMALMWSNESIEASLRGDGTGTLAWGPTLFRVLLALHGLVLIVVAIGRTVHAGAALRTWGDRPAGDESGSGVYLPLIVLCAVAIPLRLYRLETDLWIDEVYTLIEFIRPTLGETLTRYPSQNQHMLYSLMAKGATVIWGESAWAVRLPAAFFGVLSIPALFLLGRRLTDKWQALTACALMTLSYHHIWFSQNARGYTGLLFFAILSTWLWVQALPQARWGLWLGYVGAVVLGAWVHLTMVFLAISHGLTYLALLVLGRRDPSDRARLGGVVLGSRWMPLAAGGLCATLTLQVYALSLPDFLRNGLHEVSLKSEWTQVWWLIGETIRGLHIGHATWLALGMLGVVLTTGWLSIVRRNWTAGATMVIAPLLVCMLMILGSHNLWPRFVFFSAGFAILVLVHGVNLIARWLARRLLPRAGPRMEWWWAATSLGMLLAVSTATVPRNYRLPKQDYSSARDYVEQRLEPSETAVAVGLAGDLFTNYYAPDWRCARTAEALEAEIQSHPAVWLVYTMPIHVRAYHPDIWTVIQREFENAKVFPGTLAGGEVFVCRTRPARANPLKEQTVDRREPPLRPFP